MKNLIKLKEDISNFLNFKEVSDDFEIEFGIIKDKDLIVNILIKDLEFFSSKQDEIRKNLDEFFKSGEVLKNFELRKYELIFSQEKSKKVIKDSHKKKDVKGGKRNISGIKKIIMVASGKGGVGKSTFASNLALNLAELGWKVGLLDSDIYGASIPLIFNLDDQMVSVDEDSGDKMNPIKYIFNDSQLKINSIAFITRSDEALIWRGPMISKALNQILNQTNWGELDFLIIDTPPGTGDIHISLFENFIIDCIFLISTPHITSLSNTQKTFTMLEKFHSLNNIYSVLNMFQENNIQNDKIQNFKFIQNSKYIFEIPMINNFQNSLFALEIDKKNLIEKISRKIINDLCCF